MTGRDSPVGVSDRPESAGGDLRGDAFLRALHAEHVAVVGASADPTKLGHQTLRNLLEGGFQGTLYPINPKAEEILGIRCYPTIDAVPSDLDLAVIVIPASAVPEVVGQAGRKGAAACVVLSGGFRESGAQDLEEALVRAARANRTLVVGPNVQGLAYVPNRLSALMYPYFKTPGPLAIVGQSGSVTAAIGEWAEREGLGISALVNLGNKADVDEADVICWLANDAATRTMALYLEGVCDGRRFVKAAASAAATKPIVVLKAGSSAAGQRAVASHTASLAGSDAVFSAACRQFGLARAADMTELYDLAKGFALVTPPKGRRLLVISSSGGTGALAVDEASRLGLEPALLPSGYVRAIKKLGLSPRTSYANPLDIDSLEAEEFAACAALAVKHNVADTILFGLGDPVPGTPAMVRRFVDDHGLSTVVTYLGGGAIELAEAPQLHAAGIACYPSPERALRALATVVDHQRWLEEVNVSQ